MAIEPLTQKQWRDFFERYKHGRLQPGEFDRVYETLTRGQKAAIGRIGRQRASDEHYREAGGGWWPL